MIFSDFIVGEYISQHLCDELINYFETSNNKCPGKVGGIRGSGEVDLNKKISTDLPVSPKSKEPVVEQYLYELNLVCKKYISVYPWADKGHARWVVAEDFNIQRYLPNEGFKVWHFEKTGLSNYDLKRHMVFMTYLNDVNDGGQTEWFHQKLSVTPKKGLTVLWPAEWTFVHRGITSPTETKYIVTGWYSYE